MSKRATKHTEKMEARGTVQRMLNLKVVAPNTESFKRVLKVLQAYRCLWQELASAATSLEIAGGQFQVGEDFVRIKPTAEGFAKTAKAILGDSVKSSQAYYEVRPYFFSMIEKARKQDQTFPDFGGHIWDNCRVQMNAILRQTDPLLKVKHNSLVASGEARLPSARSIGLPVMRCYGDGKDGLKPYARLYAKLVSLADGSVAVDISVGSGDHPETIRLIAAGPFEIKDEIQIKKLDEGARYVLHKLLEGQARLDTWDKKTPFATLMAGLWEFQSPILNERNGQLSLLIPYTRPAVLAKDLDAKRVMEVYFQPVTDSDGKTSLMHMRVNKAANKADGWRRDAIKVDDAIESLRELDAQRRKLDFQMEATKNSRRTNYGSHVVNARLKHLRERSEHLTSRRAHVAGNTNHIWTNMILGRAVYWQCGTVKIYGIPDGKTAGMCGRKWNWSDFVVKLTYKAQEKGIQLSTIESCTPEETMKRISEGLSLEGIRKDAETSEKLQCVGI